MGGSELHGAPALIPFGVVGLVLLLRLRKAGKPRRLRLGALLVVPVIYTVLVVAVIAALPPHGIGWLWCLLALAAGSAIGWQRGRFVKIDLDPETGTLLQTQSVAGIVFLVAIVAARSVLRYEVGSDAHKATALVTALLLSFVLGVIAVQRIEMYLRGRRLMAGARAGDKGIS